MSVTVSGMYGLTLEKMFINTMAQSMEAETHKGMLIDNTSTPAFDTHAFRNAVTGEVSGTGYTTGGQTITTTDWFPGQPSAGVLKWDHDDPQWATSTITGAAALVDYFNVGTSATDALICLSIFTAPVSSSGGLLLVTIAANGVINLDYTP